MKKSSANSLLFKHLLFFLFFLPLCIHAQVPVWSWANSVGGDRDDICRTLATDADGNIYATGSFTGTVDFDPGPGVYTLSATTGNGFFITKSTPTGNLIWAKAIYGNGFADSYSLALDSRGNVYTTGWFSGTIDFDPGPGVFNLQVGGNPRIFMNKLNASGEFGWAKTFGGEVSSGASITADSFGNIYTTGFYSGLTDFDPGPGVYMMPSFSTDEFITKYDTLGNFIWAKHIGGRNPTFVKFIKTDAAGNIYTTGTFADTCDFDPGPGIYNLFPKGFQDTYISKLDSAGNFIWVKTFGGPGHTWPSSLVIDNLNNVYTTGEFDDSTDFDPGSAIFRLSSKGEDDVFVSKLDGSGNFLWAKAFGGRNIDEGNSIALDALKNVYVVGNFRDTVDFDPGVGTYSMASLFAGDVYISELDSSGNFIWAKQGGSTLDDAGTCVAVGNGANIYVAGTFFGTTANFGTNTLFNTDPSGFSKDFFIARIDMVTGISNPTLSNLRVSIFPNPASKEFTIQFADKIKQVTISLFDLSGNLLYKKNSSQTQSVTLQTMNLPAGIYLVKIEDQKSVITKKVLITD